MNLKKLFVLLILSLTIISCKNYYNDTIHWMDNLEGGLDIESVQKSAPNYIEIDWENPQTVGNQKWYFVTIIKGRNDPLGMSHYLVFENNKYQYRESKK